MVTLPRAPSPDNQWLQNPKPTSGIHRVFWEWLTRTFEALRASIAGMNAIEVVAPTKADAEALVLDEAPDAITLLGYLSADDGGGAKYKRVSAQPLHAGKFSITVEGSTVWYEIDEWTVNELMFGAVAAASNAAQTAAINAMLVYAGATIRKKCHIIRSHTITATIVVPAYVVVEWMGAYVGAAVLTKGFNGTMMTMAVGSQLIRPYLVGDGANFTGYGILINSGTDQALEYPIITGMEDACLRFDGSGSGGRFHCRGGLLQRQNTANGAVVGPDTELSTTGFRDFQGVHGGGSCLFDVRAGNYFTLTDCAMTNIIFTVGTSQRVLMTNCRVAGPIVVYGNQHSFDGNAFGNTVTFAVGSFGCRFARSNLHSGLIDLASEVTNVLESPDYLVIRDPPSAAPGAVAGQAFIYVDPADGDLKVKFGDGTVKTIVTDT